MIKLTKTDGDAWYLNPDHVSSIDGMIVTLSNGSWEYVNESPEAVVAKIMQYKLSMEDYRIGSQQATRSGAETARIAEKRLAILAGLPSV